MTAHKPASPLPRKAGETARDYASRQDRAERTRREAAYPKLVATIKNLELLARVNAPVFDGSPAHKGICALLRSLGELP